MKSIFKYMAILAAGIGLAACSPEEFEGASGNVPQASDYADNFTVTVDQSTNNATFEFISAPGVTPVWIIDGAYSTAYSFTRFYRKAGTYSVECKVRNADGISDGSITKEFIIEKTQMNGFGGFDPESDFNLFKGVTFGEPSFYYAPGWAQIANPSYTYIDGTYTLSLPTATTERWQAQMLVETGVAITADKTYDFSVIMTSTTAHNAVKVKICQADDDNLILMDQDFSLEANEPKALWASELEGVDLSNVKVVFDFGGNADNTDIIIESFVLKDHANDDGTEIPDAPEQPEPTWSDVDSPDNLWSTANYATSFYYAPGWAQIADPTYSLDGTAHTLTFAEATGEKWQNQFTLTTDNVALSAGESYDFRVIVHANAELPAMTYKFCQADDDATYLFELTTTVAANEDVAVKAINVPGVAITQGKLVFDFGGNAANTTVTLSDIILQVHKD